MPAMSSLLLIHPDARAADTICRAVLAADATHLAVAGTVPDLQRAAEFLVERMTDLIVVDLGVPDGPLPRWLDHLRTDRRPHPRVLVIARALRDPALFAALRAGVDGYVLQDEPPQAVLEAMETVLAGGSTMAPEIARCLLLQIEKAVAAGGEPLAPTDRELLKWLGSGYALPEIAPAMQTTEKRLAVRLRGVYRRMQERPFDRPLDRRVKLEGVCR